MFAALHNLTGPDPYAVNELGQECRTSLANEGPAVILGCNADASGAESCVPWGTGAFAESIETVHSSPDSPRAPRVAQARRGTRGWARRWRWPRSSHIGRIRTTLHEGRRGARNHKRGRDIIECYCSGLFTGWCVSPASRSDTVSTFFWASHGVRGLNRGIRRRGGKHTQ
jgi:hypothetical protein